MATKKSPFRFLRRVPRRGQARRRTPVLYLGAEPTEDSNVWRDHTGRGWWIKYMN